jgi:hypothetical protein
MSSSDRNIRKPDADGLNNDDLAAERAGDRSTAEFPLVGGDLAEVAAEAAAANQLAPEEEEDEDRRKS